MVEQLLGLLSAAGDRAHRGERGERHEVEVDVERRPADPLQEVEVELERLAVLGGRFVPRPHSMLFRPRLRKGRSSPLRTRLWVVELLP